MLIRYPPTGKGSEQGYTIMESLVAIVVVTIVLVSTAQTLALVVATRVQNRKAEQAQALAQQEVDRIRVLVEQGGYTIDDLPTNKGTGDAQLVAAPSSLADIQEVDLDNDDEIDFLVQTFRTKDTVLRSDGLPEGFEMGVRVYSARAEQNLGSLGTEQASLQMTTGTGRQTINPLGVIYTSIVRNDRSYSLCLLNPGLCS